VELEAQSYHDEDNQGIGKQTGEHSRAVVWRIFGTKNCGADDAPNTVKKLAF
jgi:hypothetical protein